MRVIVNADDFGASHSINEAIVQSAKDGFITSATILAVAANHADAIRLSENFPNMSFGIHLALTGDFPALSQNGRLNQIPWGFKGLNLFNVPKIIKEFSFQIEQLQALGLKISHIDTHHHIQRFPLVLLAITIVARKYKIKKLRSQIMLEKKSLPNRAYRYTHHQIGRLLGMQQSDCHVDFIYFEKCLGEIQNQKMTVEIMCHPGGQYNDEAYFTEDFYQQFRKSLISYQSL